MKCGTVFCHYFFLCLVYRFSSLSLFHSNNTILWWKKGTKLLHHIRYKCFNFLCIFFVHSTIYFSNNEKKIQTHFYALPANISFCVHNIHSKSTKELRLGSLIVVVKLQRKKKRVSWRKKKTRQMQEINIISPDLLITFSYRLLFDIKRLIFFGIWSIWPLNIGNAEIHIAILYQ